MTAEARRWTPSLGASVKERGTRFRVWAPNAERVEVMWSTLAGDRGTAVLGRAADGYHDRLVEGVSAGARYRFVLDGSEPLPDPASRYQPDGVHGASEVV